MTENSPRECRHHIRNADMHRICAFESIIAARIPSDARCREGRLPARALMRTAGGRTHRACHFTSTRTASLTSCASNLWGSSSSRPARAARPGMRSRLTHEAPFSQR